MTTHILKHYLLFAYYDIENPISHHDDCNAYLKTSNSFGWLILANWKINEYGPGIGLSDRQPRDNLH